eukprot:TRINITY_DN5834_c0_g3_i1.p1 TRINITY_DN5834_c0_g3~~TRINITY_DN5834_c0_g3_i1.p1  ORF type:complete len:729 (-),score=153.95 TRINITY_DN5834_c0_g3_i1:28-2214(-)
MRESLPDGRPHLIFVVLGALALAAVLAAEAPPSSCAGGEASEGASASASACPAALALAGDASAERGRAGHDGEDVSLLQVDLHVSKTAVPSAASADSAGDLRLAPGKPESAAAPAAPAAVSPPRPWLLHGAHAVGWSGQRTASHRVPLLAAGALVFFALAYLLGNFCLPGPRNSLAGSERCLPAAGAALAERRVVGRPLPRPGAAGDGASDLSGDAAAGLQNDCDFASRTPVWLLVFMGNAFVGCAGFALVLPTLWPLLQEMGASTRFLAAAVALFSIGEGAGGLLAGQVYQRYDLMLPKAVLLGGMTLGLSASLLYASAPMLGPSVGLYVVMAARFMQGLDAGIRQTLQQSFVGDIVPARHVARALAQLGSVSVAGLLVGPALAAPLQAFALKTPALGIHLDGNSAPGLLMSCLSLVNVATTALLFRPCSLVTKGHVAIVGGDSATASLGKVAMAGSQHAEPPRPLGLLACYAVGFVFCLSVSAMETVAPVVLQQHFGWGPCAAGAKCRASDPRREYINLLFVGGAVLSLTAAVVAPRLLADAFYGHERRIISVGLATVALASLGSMDWFGSLPAWRFVAAYLLGVLFASFLSYPSVSLLMQVVGPHPKAPYMGRLVAAGSLPRLLGPYIFERLLVWPAHGPSVATAASIPGGEVLRTWLLYGTMAMVQLATLLFLQVAGSALRPHPAFAAGRAAAVAASKASLQAKIAAEVAACSPQALTKTEGAL